MTLHRKLERSRVVNAFTEAARQYPHDDMLALDHAGRVVMHTATSPRIGPRVGSAPLLGAVLMREVRRRWFLARSADGGRHAWAARSVTTGRGEGASGLRFDVAKLVWG
jgi:hypothetical protein